MIRGAFFDIDGTLLSHRTGSIPASASRAIRSLHEQGVLTFIATGRHIQEMESVPGLMDLPWDGFVTLDGQYCADRKGAYFTKALDPGDVDRLIFHSRRLGIPCMLVEEDEMYISTSSPRVKQIQEQLKVPPVPVRSLTESGTRPVYLAATYCERKDQEILMKELLFARSAQWHEYGFDIYHRDGGKDVGILKTCERFGITPEETVAFGDSENDEDMLKFAGVGVAMGNATGEVKAVCDLVTADIDENGIERALVELGLIRV